jgi:hypothetical protein
MGIYRNENDIKMPVLPRYEGSPKVLFMLVFIISCVLERCFSLKLYGISMPAATIMSLVGAKDLQWYN